MTGSLQSEIQNAVDLSTNGLQALYNSRAILYQDRKKGQHSVDAKVDYNDY